MAKNQYKKNSRNQTSTNLSKLKSEKSQESQLIVEETMEMRLNRCVQKSKDLSELVIGYTPYKLNFAISSFTGVTNKPSKVSAFANAVVGIILADGQSSFSHIGQVLGLNVDIDLAEHNMLENAIKQMLDIHLLEGDESAYNVTEQGRTFAEHGEKMEPYPSKFSLWYIPEYTSYLNLYSDISENFVVDRPEDEFEEISALSLEEIKSLAEKQADHAHSSKDRRILQEATLENTQLKSYDLWACFIRSVRTKQVRVLIYDDNTQKIIVELSNIVNDNDSQKKKLYDSMLGESPDVEILEQKDAIASDQQIQAEAELLREEEEQNNGNQTDEESSSLVERLHKRALYDTLSFESELHTIFQQDNADEIWLSSTWVGDDAFMQSRLPLIQTFLQQGGKVFISYSEAEEGLDNNGKRKMIGWQSKRAINNLAKSYQGQFFYAQFPAFHSKNVIEVKNGQSILFTGSFNVLSFHVVPGQESHIRKEEMALAHYQVAENKYQDIKKQFAVAYIKRAADSLEYLPENAILHYKNQSLDYFRKDDTLASLFADFDEKLDELKFAVRNKRFVRKVSKPENVSVTNNIESGNEFNPSENENVVGQHFDEHKEKADDVFLLAKKYVDADLIDESDIFLKLVSLCYLSIGDNSQKVELQVPWPTELLGFLSRTDVQKEVKINVMKGKEEGTTNVHVLIKNNVFRFFNLKLTKAEFFTLFNRKEAFPKGNKMPNPWEMKQIIIGGKENV